MVDTIGNESSDKNWILVVDTNDQYLLWPPLSCSCPSVFAQEYAFLANGEDVITGNEPYDKNWILVDATQNLSLPSSWSSPPILAQEFSTSVHAQASTSTGPCSDFINQFVQMGFPKSMVTNAIEENGESNAETILETLLTMTALKKSPSQQWEPGLCDPHSSDSEKDTFDDLSDSDSCFDNKEDAGCLQDEEEKKLLHLVDMGFPIDEASSAINASGPDTSITELMDFIYAGQMATTFENPLQEPPHMILKFDEDDDYYEMEFGHNHVSTPTKKKRKKLFEAEDRWERTRKLQFRQNKKREFSNEDAVTSYIPKYMIGFGVPNVPRPILQRNLPTAAIGLPYFYFENVACTLKGVWSTISRFLYEIEPEFVDSLHFSAAARKRGYVHNLPIHNRYPLMPIPPLTIQEALPLTKTWWPTWDKRTKLNCLRTCAGCPKITERIKNALESCDGVPNLHTQDYVLHECKKWNLLWVGRNRVALLEPDEMEMILGYPENHTRGGGTNRMDRYKALGNAFQVDTVAYHFSVLKSIFPNGITLLSLFSGIGGAEVALHRLGVPLKNVVSVEISAVNRKILRSWWEQTNQSGNLIELEDVQELGADKLEHLIHVLGGFDLIVGGSPCNNLTGSNRSSRDGLGGTHSILFYDYFRIVDTVKCIMVNRQ